MSKPLDNAHIFDNIADATQQVTVNSLQEMTAMHLYILEAIA
jgi:hypothetical protein